MLVSSLKSIPSDMYKRTKDRVRERERERERERDREREREREYENVSKAFLCFFKLLFFSARKPVVIYH